MKRMELTMFIMLNIPPHKNCINCGKCCGPVPVNIDETAEIQMYLANRPEIIAKAEKNNTDTLTCKFRDKESKRCMIYSARPLVCRLMGVTKGMACDNGNSAEIDGSKFVERIGFDGMRLINEIDFKTGGKA